VTDADNMVHVTGRLVMDTTAALFNTGLKFKPGVKELVVDLAQIEAVDSSAVSLMLAWLRAAQRSNVKLTFVNISDNLFSLAELYGVDETLLLRSGANS